MRLRRSYRSHHVGRVRIAAADILSRGLGFVVDPTDIRPATGAYRTDRSIDVYRWELFTRDRRGMPIVGGCWLTLTEFVRLAKRDGWHMDSDGEIWPGARS